MSHVPDKVEILISKYPEAREPVRAFFEALPDRTKVRLLSAQIARIKQMAKGQATQEEKDNYHRLALALSQTAVQNYPDNVYFVNQEAECLLFLHKPEEAIAVIEHFEQRVGKEGIELSASERCYLSITKSSAFVSLGRFDLAEKSLDGLPANPNVIEQRIEIYYKKGQYEEVVKLGERYQPRKPVTRVQWARSVIQIGGSVEKAIAVLEPVKNHEEVKDFYNKLKTRGTGAGPQDVVVVSHTRHPASQLLFQMLKALGLSPIDFETKAVEWAATSHGPSPYVGQVLEAMFSRGQVIVVLMTGDEWARLHERFITAETPESEQKWALQPRPNVIFEAGIALGGLSERTILVELGDLRLFSDILGRYTVRLRPTSNDDEVLRQWDNFLKRLETVLRHEINRVEANSKALPLFRSLLDSATKSS